MLERASRIAVRALEFKVGGWRMWRAGLIAILGRRCWGAGSWARRSKRRAVIVCRGGPYCNRRPVVQHLTKRNHKLHRLAKQLTCHLIRLRDQILATSRLWLPRSISMMVSRIWGAMKISGDLSKEMLTMASTIRSFSKELASLEDWLRRGMIWPAQLDQKIEFMNPRRAISWETM